MKAGVIPTNRHEVVGSVARMARDVAHECLRPGTTGGFGQGIGAPFTAAGGNRQPFFPQLAAAPDPLQPPEAGPGAVLPPAGHPVVFNNTMGYFPSPYGTRGGPRPGLAGVGGGRR